MKQTWKMHVSDGILCYQNPFWIRIYGKTVWIGIVDQVSDQLGELMLIELPELGEKLCRGGIFGLIRSIKTAVELKMPVSGKIAAVNPKLEYNPELIQTDPFGLGWVVAIEMEDISEIEKLRKSLERDDVFSPLPIERRV